MNVSDVADQLLVDNESVTAFDALAVLSGGYKHVCPDFYGGGPPCARQLPSETIARLRAALAAAASALDAASVRCPSGPLLRLVPTGEAR